jgi:prepilin-type N-terminal cleavage/methylation domain-containing protein
MTSTVRFPLGDLRLLVVGRASRRSWLPAGFSLIEIILVMALLGIAAAILVPSVGSAFTVYHLERASEDLQARLIRTRLQAMEWGVPYAFTYRPNNDQFMTWACEPLVTNSSVVSGTTTSSQLVDAYDRRVFELNDKEDNREFRFLSTALDEALGSMGMGHEGRSVVDQVGSGASVGSSVVLSRRKLGLVAPSIRSTAALQIPSLQVGDVVEPIVFEPDGTVDRDAIIRIADSSNRYVEITIHALTGAVSSSEVLSGDQLAAAGSVTVPARTGFVTPSRSRERRTGGSQ